jgi:hypothetical protein
MAGKNIFSVKGSSKKRSVFKDEISSDGKSFIFFEYEDKYGGHSQEYNPDQTKEFFSKFLKMRFSNEHLKSQAREMFKAMFGVKDIKKIDEDGSIHQIYHLLKEIIYGKRP